MTNKLILKSYDQDVPSLQGGGNISGKHPDLLKKGGKKNWIQGAVNPEHKGYCTPMTKSTCTPKRKAFAMTMKKHHGFHKKEDGGLILSGTQAPRGISSQEEGGILTKKQAMKDEMAGNKSKTLKPITKYGGKGPRKVIVEQEGGELLAEAGRPRKVKRPASNMRFKTGKLKSKKCRNRKRCDIGEGEETLQHPMAKLGMVFAKGGLVKKTYGPETTSPVIKKNTPPETKTTNMVGEVEKVGKLPRDGSPELSSNPNIRSAAKKLAQKKYNESLSK